MEEVICTDEEMAAWLDQKKDGGSARQRGYGNLAQLARKVGIDRGFPFSGPLTKAMLMGRTIKERKQAVALSPADISFLEDVVCSDA